MATTYLGFFGPTGSALPNIEASLRETGLAPQEFREKVNGFPASLPAGTTLIGSWASLGGERPSVMVVETEDYSGLQHIQNYYSGWLQFEWHPTTTGGVSRDQ